MIKAFENLISEGRELKNQTVDWFGTKNGSLDIGAYTSWRQRCIKAINDIGKSGDRLIKDIENHPYVQQPYDITIEQILGNLEAALEFAKESLMSGKDINTDKISKVTNKKVFIIHGHDEAAKQTVARFIEHLELEPIILHEKPNKGRTLIEKVLDNAETVDFAIALLTPDDEGYSVKQPSEKRKRARQNVIFELGLFIGKLGRQRVVALHKDIENPSDLGGVVYIQFDEAGAWKLELSKELNEVFDGLDLNRLIRK